ncbi:MAG TPA: DUF4142 domain-containing protein [Flavitalea sp.]|nr:DUF4142 domain-containing protein [Flavitalea sp.]
MKIRRLLPSFMATMTLIVGACSILNGQADTTMRKGHMQGDAAFVAKNITDNEKEIRMSQMALDKSDNSRIKTLAQRMVEDHTKMLEDLRNIQGTVRESSNDMNNMGDSGNNMGNRHNEGNMNDSSWKNNRNQGNMNDTGWKNNRNQGNMNDTGWNNNRNHGNMNDTGMNNNRNRGSMSDTGWNKNRNNNGNNMQNDGSMSKPGDTATATNQVDRGGMKTSSSDSSADGNMNDAGNMQSSDNDDNMPMMNETGKAFDNMWVANMLKAHSKKLTELQSASKQVTNPDLKRIIQQAIPKVRMHKEKLQALNKPGSYTKSKSKSK